MPYAILTPWPTNPLFYIATLATVPIASYTDVIYFEGNKKYGAGVVSRLLPLGLIVSFVGWLLVKPEQISMYLASPVYGGGVVVSLGLTVFFASRLRHCNVSKNAFVFLLPLIFFDGILNILNKTAMDSAELHQSVWFYLMLQGAGVAIFSAVKEQAREKTLIHLFDKKVIKAGICIFCFAIMAGPLKGYALHDIDNPAYVSAVYMLYPFWIFIIYKIVKRKEDGIDIFSGLLLVLSVIALVLCKSMV